MSDDPEVSSDASAAPTEASGGSEPEVASETSNAVEPMSWVPLTVATELSPGARIGAYVILEKLADGGFGSVYKAEQRDPVRRLVAIKLIKSGFDTKEVLARFTFERQALAQMDHPNIAKVFDAGVTGPSSECPNRPYIVMEFVRGLPLVQLADHERMSVRQRLELFSQVCDAIHHAHQKAIIHRDIKPTNVLAYLDGGKPIAKVIDFGIAKILTADRLTDLTVNTGEGVAIGTYEAMSPEQASGSPDIDTRTDVYSLGVMLYELLSGVHPFRQTMIRRGDVEIRRIIREDEPERPSTKLSRIGDRAAAISAARQTRSRELRRQLQSELEWIPLKAMRKQRSRRYASVDEFRRDIDNYLSGRPLVAAPESRAYQLRKFASRHRGALAAVSAVATTLVLGVIVTSSLAVRARRAEQRAQAAQRDADQRRAIADATLDFLNDDVLSGATPANIPDEKVRDQIVHAMIEPAVRKMGTKFKDQPLVNAAVREAIQNVLTQVGRSDLALPEAEQALAIRRKLLGDSGEETIAAANSVANVLQTLGRNSDAEKLLKEFLPPARTALGERNPTVISLMCSYANVLESLDRAAEAEPILKEALAARRAVFGNDRRETLSTLDDYAFNLQSQGRYDEAVPLFREALAGCTRALGSDDPDTIGTMNNLGYTLKQKGELKEAEPLYKESMERSERVLGPDHPDTIGSLNNYAQLLMAMNRVADAEPLLKQVVERSSRAAGMDHTQVLMAQSNYARALTALGRAPEAEAIAHTALAAAIADVDLGEKHHLTRQIAVTESRCLDALGRSDQARQMRDRFALAEATQPVTQSSAQSATQPTTGP